MKIIDYKNKINDYIKNKINKENTNFEINLDIKEMLNNIKKFCIIGIVFFVICIILDLSYILPFLISLVIILIIVSIIIKQIDNQLKLKIKIKKTTK